MSEEIKQEEVKVEVEKEEVVKEKSMVKKVFGWIGTGLLTLLVVMASWLCFDKFVLKHRVPSIFEENFLVFQLILFYESLQFPYTRLDLYHHFWSSWSISLDG